MATTGEPSIVATTVPASMVSPPETMLVTVPATGDETVADVVNPSVAVVSS